MKIRNYKELAKIAGCGVGTISRYFSGGSISEEMYERITAILKQNDFIFKGAQNRTVVNFLVFSTLFTKISNVLEIFSKKLLENNISLNIILFNNDFNLLKEKIIDLEHQQNNKIILFIDDNEEINDFLQKKAPNDNLIIWGENIQNFSSIYFSFATILEQLIKKFIIKTKNILYLSIGTEYRQIYREYFKSCISMDIKPNYLTLKAENYEDDLLALTNAVIDNHIDLIVCADEYSYLLSKSLKNIPVEIVTIIFNLILEQKYLSLSQKIAVNYELLITKVIELLINNSSNFNYQISIELIS